jgi:hypothetical protein
MILKNKSAFQEYYSSIFIDIYKIGADSKVEYLDYLCYQSQINYLMKNQSTPFESMG